MEREDSEPASESNTDEVVIIEPVPVDDVGPVLARIEREIADLRGLYDSLRSEREPATSLGADDSGTDPSAGYGTDQAPEAPHESGDSSGSDERPRTRHFWYRKLW